MADAEFKTIAIIGASYAGISTAHYLLKHVLPKLPEASKHQVVLVSPSEEVLCRPACPRAMISDAFFDQSKLFVNIEEQFKQYPSGLFKFIKAAVTGWNYQQRRITVQAASEQPFELEYHALVIATGAWARSPLLGMTGDSQQLRASWKVFREALGSAKSIVIAGGGPAGVETAGELGEHLNGRASGWFGGGSKPNKIDITLITSANQLLPALRTSIASKADGNLAAVGVKIIKNRTVAKVEPSDSGTTSIATPSTVTLDNNETLQADIYIPATGTTPNTSFIDPPLLAKDRRITTNLSTLRVDAAGPRVYALGDASSAARPAIHLIFEQVPIVCANIKRDLLLAAGSDEVSAGADRVFKEDTRETQMVLIGKGVGVGAAMGWALPSWVVKMIKRDYWLWTTGDLWSGRQWKQEK